MKLKALVFAFAAALVMVGCDSSTSSETETQELPDSSASQNTPASSTSKDGTDKTNSSASVADVIKDLDSKNLTPEQRELLKSFQTKLSILPGGEELAKECEDGATLSSTIMEQEVTYTCLSNIWMPTSGFDKLLEGLSPEQLEMAANLSGVSSEELKLLVDFFANADFTNSSVNMTCDGEENDNTWSVEGTGAVLGSSVKLSETSTFEGNSMTSTRNEEMDMGSEAICKAFINAPDENDEETLADEQKNVMLYGEIVEDVYRCEGSKMVHSEKRTKDNVSADERAAAYADLVGKCKDYRDGKITFEEFIE
jgi:hypothetical protein